MLTGATQGLLSVAARQELLQCWTVLLLSLSQMMILIHRFHCVRTLTVAEPPCCAACSDLSEQGLRAEVGHINPAVQCCMALPLVLSMSMDMPCTVKWAACVCCCCRQPHVSSCTAGFADCCRGCHEALLAALPLSCTCRCRQSKSAPVKPGSFLYGSSQTMNQGVGNGAQSMRYQDTATGQGAVTRRRGAASQAASQQQASLRQAWQHLVAGSCWGAHLPGSAFGAQYTQPRLPFWVMWEMRSAYRLNTRSNSLLQNWDGLCPASLVSCI